MRCRELAEALLERAARPDRHQGTTDDRVGGVDVLAAIHDWVTASGEPCAGERREEFLRTLDFLLTAADTARSGPDGWVARNSALEWVAHVLHQLTDGQERICGDAWRTVPLRTLLDTLTDQAADLGGVGAWGWLAMAESAVSPAVRDALLQAACAGAEAHALLTSAVRAVDAAEREWAIDTEGAST